MASYILTIVVLAHIPNVYVSRALSWTIAVVAEQVIQQELQVVFVELHLEYWAFAEMSNVAVISGERD